ncbi:hypothetical protein GGR58DRAFT_501035 [Xylaria digitata]|nr:hypothetical protein GGR58DRAFT_501035 [Xylaria digitata]
MPVLELRLFLESLAHLIDNIFFCRCLHRGNGEGPYYRLWVFNDFKIDDDFGSVFGFWSQPLPRTIMHNINVFHCDDSGFKALPVLVALVTKAQETVQVCPSKIKFCILTLEAFLLYLIFPDGFVVMKPRFSAGYQNAFLGFFKFPKLFSSKLQENRPIPVPHDNSPDDTQDFLTSFLSDFLIFFLRVYLKLLKVLLHNFIRFLEFL